jgi:hypothetical protein
MELGLGLGSDRGGLGQSRLRFRLRLRRPPQPFGVGQPPHAVGLSVLDAGGVALHADAQTFAEVERLLVGEPELPCQLVDPDPLGCHLVVL